MHPQACSRSRQLFTRRRQPQQLFQSLPTHPLGLALGQRLDNLCLTSTEAEASPRGTEKHLGPQPLEGKLVPQQIAGRTSHPGVPQAHYTSTACIQQNPESSFRAPSSLLHCLAVFNTAPPSPRLSCSSPGHTSCCQTKPLPLFQSIKDRAKDFYPR